MFFVYLASVSRQVYGEGNNQLKTKHMYNKVPYLFHLNAQNTSFACVDEKHVDDELGKRADALLDTLAKAFGVPIREMNEDRAGKKMKILRGFSEILVEDFPHLRSDKRILQKFINREIGIICQLLNPENQGNLVMRNYESFKSDILRVYRKNYPPIPRVTVQSSTHVFRSGGPRTPIVIPPFKKLETLPFDVCVEILFTSLGSVFTGVTKESLLKSVSSHEAEIITMRRMIFFGCKAIYGDHVTLAKMGSIFGQDHGTVFSAIRRHHKMMGLFGADARLYQDRVAKFLEILFKNVEDSLELNTVLSFEEGFALITEGVDDQVTQRIFDQLQKLAMQQRVFPRGFFLEMREGVGKT